MVDFGDLQIFEGVTTYPAILTLRKGAAGGGSDLSYLNVKERLPDDLGRAFAQGARPMRRTRLGRGSWRFEEDALARLRDKIARGRKTLGEVYGPPLYGIKTGLNEAFVIDRATRDRLVAADPRSADLLKPFLRGENVKRWRVESEDLFLINTPKGKVDIERYPAIRDWLLPFRPELDGRATKQQWWELQQAQLAYQEIFAHPKIVYQDITSANPFALDESGFFLANTCYFVSLADRSVLSYLNSKVSWFQLSALTNIARGGYLRLRSDFVERLIIPKMLDGSGAPLAILGQTCTDAARARFKLQSAVRHRILDLAPPDRRKLTGKLEGWHALDFAAFRDEVRKAFHADIPLKQRGDWEAYLGENAAEVHRLSAEIETAEREIDATVYRLFDLTADEIALLEGSLAGQY